MTKRTNIILIAIVVLLILVPQSFYIVSQPTQAIVLQFGEPVRLVKEPGLKIKIPFIWLFNKTLACFTCKNRGCLS